MCVWFLLQELFDDDTLIETSGSYPPGTASFIRDLEELLTVEGEGSKFKYIRRATWLDHVFQFRPAD